MGIDSADWENPTFSGNPKEEEDPELMRDSGVAYVAYDTSMLLLADAIGSDAREPRRETACELPWQARACCCWYWCSAAQGEGEEEMGDTRLEDVRVQSNAQGFIYTA